jgi:hypothetical protein
MLVSNSAIEIGIPIATILVSGLAAYFGAFIKTMAANDANNQNFEKVLEQMKTQTAEIENIKAAISDDVWDRQKQWEMRRDVVFEVLRSLGQYDNALLELCVAYSTSIEDVDSAMTSRLEKGGNWNRIGANLDGTGFLVVAICGDTLYKALSAYLKGTRAVANDILNGKPERYTASQGDRANQIKALRAAVRKELNME